jgi:hypothetical protein
MAGRFKDAGHDDDTGATHFLDVSANAGWKILRFTKPVSSCFLHAKMLRITKQGDMVSDDAMDGAWQGRQRRNSEVCGSDGRSGAWKLPACSRRG